MWFVSWNKRSIADTYLNNSLSTFKNIALLVITKLKIIPALILMENMHCLENDPFLQRLGN